MKKFTLSFTFAASAIVVATFQANGSDTSSLRTSPARDAQACKVLVRKMETTSSANTWRNRVRTWKCRDDLSPDTPEIAALRQEPSQ